MATINGNGQANFLNGTANADIMRGRNGNDTMLGAEGDDSILGNAGNDSMDGGLGNDTLKGGNGDDWIFGGDGNDLVVGNKGNDRLIASAGNDTLNGGHDTDTAVFSGNRDDYSVVQVNSTTVLITALDGSVARAVNIELFEFADMTQSFAEVLLPRDPNLAASGLTSDGTLAVQGDTLNFDWQLQSDGDIDAAPSETQLVVATAPDLASAVSFAGQQTTGVLATGSTGSFSGALDTSGLAPGTYYVAAVADSSDVLDENNEADNLTDWIEVTVDAQTTDLRATSIGVGDRVIGIDETQLVRIGLIASGNTDAGPSVVELTVSTSPDFASAVYSDQVALGALATGSTPLVDFTLDWNDLAPGTYYVAAEVDAGDAIGETDETNNVTTWEEITVIPEIVDYALTAVNVQYSDLNLLPSGDPGGQLNLSFDLENIGNSGPTSFRIETYLSQDGTLSADDIHLELITGLGTSIPFTIDLGTTPTVWGRYAIDQFVPIGDYQVIAVINADGGDDPLDDVSDNTAVAGPVTLTGGSTLGTSGDDLFTSALEHGAFYGLAGDDTLTGDSVGDVFEGGAGIDTIDFSDRPMFGVYVSAASYTVNRLVVDSNNNVFGNGELGYIDGVERIIGTDFDDTVFAEESDLFHFDLGDGNDAVMGSFADDTILGGAGNDTMGGSIGDDLITTGDGFDIVFVDREMDSGTALGQGHDVVTDFDPILDILAVEYDSYLESYDPLADIAQTAEGVLLTYATDSTVLLEGVSLADMNSTNLFGYEEFYTEVYG